MQAFPKLAKEGMLDQTEEFHLEQVLSYLAEYIWVRRTNGKGVLNFFSRLMNLGVKYRKQHLFIHLDRLNNQWVISQDF